MFKTFIFIKMHSHVGKIVKHKMVILECYPRVEKGSRAGRVLDKTKSHCNANVMTSACKAHVLTRFATIGRTVKTQTLKSETLFSCYLPHWVAIKRKLRIGNMLSTCCYDYPLDTAPSLLTLVFSFYALMRPRLQKLYLEDCIQKQLIMQFICIISDNHCTLPLNSANNSNRVFLLKRF